MLNAVQKLFTLAVIGLMLLTSCKRCIKSHKEMVHHEASTIYVCTAPTKNGCLVMTPITTPAHDSLEDVCDEYEK